MKKSYLFTAIVAILLAVFCFSCNSPTQPKETQVTVNVLDEKTEVIEPDVLELIARSNANIPLTTAYDKFLLNGNDMCFSPKKRKAIPCLEYDPKVDGEVYGKDSTVIVGGCRCITDNCANCRTEEAMGNTFRYNLSTYFKITATDSSMQKYISSSEKKIENGKYSYILQTFTYSSKFNGNANVTHNDRLFEVKFQEGKMQTYTLKRIANTKTGNFFPMQHLEGISLLNQVKEMESISSKLSDNLKNIQVLKAKIQVLFDASKALQKQIAAIVPLRIPPGPGGCPCKSSGRCEICMPSGDAYVPLQKKYKMEVDNSIFELEVNNISIRGLSMTENHFWVKNKDFTGKGNISIINGLVKQTYSVEIKDGLMDFNTFR